MHRHLAQTALITSTLTLARNVGVWLPTTNNTSTNNQHTKWSLRHNTHPRTRRSTNSPVTFFPATMRVNYISRSQLAVEQHMTLITMATPAAVTVARISSPGPSSTLRRTARWTQSLRCASQRTERRPKSRGPRRRPRRTSSSTRTTGSSRRITN